MELRIKDVAKYAGVSPATVSRTLNGHPHVKEDIRKKVQEAIQTLGYRPNNIARSMRTQSTHVLGFLERDVHNVNFTKVMGGADKVAGELGYSIMLCNSQGDSSKEDFYIQLLLSQRVDGLIIFVADERINNLRPVVAAGIPFVMAESYIPGIQADSAASDGEHGIYLAARHLLDLGHRSIGVILSKENILPSKVRYEGYQRAMREAGITPDILLVRFCTYSEKDGEREMDYLLKLGEARPTAIIAGSSQITAGALRAVSKNGIKIPDELSLVGFDDNTLSELFSPPLTVVTRNMWQLGEEAVKLLIQRLNGENDPKEYKQITQTCSLLVRGSTRAPGV